MIFLTEDKISNYLRIVLGNCGFGEDDTAILPYNGIVSINLLKPLIKQIKDISKAKIFVHRDRDYLEPDEIEEWKKSIRELGAEPFVTSELDIEGYFCTKEYLEIALDGRGVNISDLYNSIGEGEIEDTLSSYVNGRIDHERKMGTIGKLDIGRLSAAASKKVGSDIVGYMKGKRKLSKIRYLLQTKYQQVFPIDKQLGVPTDKLLIDAAKKYIS